MTVKKHRSVAEMGATGSLAAHDPSLARVMREVWEFSSRLARTTAPRGVRKYRSIEELNQDRGLWP